MNAVLAPANPNGFRDFIRRILNEWGEMEFQGEYAARFQSSTIGRMVKDGAAPCGAFGSTTPLLYISPEVSRMSRALALLKERPGGERMCRALWLRYATGYRRGPGGVARVGHEADDDLRAKEMGVTVGNYRVMVSRTIDTIEGIWRSAEMPVDKLGKNRLTGKRRVDCL